MGRFLSADPGIILGAPLSLTERMNAYLYCGNNPVRYTDPSGMIVPPIVNWNLQNVGTWRSDSIGGGDSFASGGCALALASNILSTHTGHRVTPKDVYEYEGSMDTKDRYVWNNPITKAAGLTAERHFEALTLSKYNELNSDPAMAHYLGVQVVYATINGEKQTHWVGIDEMIVIAGIEYYVIDPTSISDINTIGENRSQEGWVIDCYGRTLIPVSLGRGYVDYSAPIPSTPLGNQNTSSTSSNSSQEENQATSNPCQAPSTDKIICAELYRQDRMPEHIYIADERFGAMLAEKYPLILRGYKVFAVPIVKLMRRSQDFSRIVNWIVEPWTEEMAFRMGALEKGNAVGLCLMLIGFIVCCILGLFSHFPVLVILSGILLVFIIRRGKAKGRYQK